MGAWSAFALFLIGAAYIPALTLGFMARGLDQPIVDPLLATMEVLTLLAAPLMLILMAAIHGYAASEDKTSGVIALAFMTLVAGMTSAVHFVELTAKRGLGFSGIVWPSATYAIELLAWNLFLGLSLLFAARVFHGGGLSGQVRRGLTVSGVLCVAGISGPAVGNMRLQLVGILGYAGVFPVVCLMLAKLFRKEASPAGLATPGNR